MKDTTGINFEKFVADKRNKDWREQPNARSDLAKKIAPRFGVNRGVVEVRFHREGIWPAE